MPGTENVGNVLSLVLPDSDATGRLGRALAPCLRRGDVVALDGPLGAGKTALARALIQERARAQNAPAEDVPSPTFTLVQVYELPDMTLWHFDLYRIGGPDEAWELGVEEAFESGISLIEWPERISALLPPDRLNVRLEFQSDATGRRAILEGRGAWAARLVSLWPEVQAHAAA